MVMCFYEAQRRLYKKLFQMLDIKGESTRVVHRPKHFMEGSQHDLPYTWYTMILGTQTVAVTYNYCDQGAECQY